MEPVRYQVILSNRENGIRGEMIDVIQWSLFHHMTFAVSLNPIRWPTQCEGIGGYGRVTEREFARKVRTLSGNYQLLQLQPWLLTRANPIRFEFISHKILRLVVPFALLAALLACAFLPQTFYRSMFWLQLAFYALSLVGLAHLKMGPIARAGDAAFTFVVLNSAALVAFAKFVSGRKVAWTR